MNLCEFMKIHLIKKNDLNIYFKLFDLYEFVLNLFETMHTAALPHTAAHCRTARQPHTAARTVRQSHTAARHTAVLPDTAVRSAAHCRTLHEFECRTPQPAYYTPHTTVAHRN
jgi:hypothetical protein